MNKHQINWRNLLYLSSSFCFILVIIIFKILNSTSYYQNEILINVFIILEFCLMLFYIITTKKHKKHWLILVGVLFAFIGELIYDWAPKDISYYGLSLYAITAVCFIAYYFYEKKFHIKDLYLLVPFAILWIVFVATMFSLKADYDILILIAFTFYSLLLCLMLWRASCLNFKNKLNLIILFGSLLWFISDSLLMCGTLYFDMNNYPFVLDIVLWLTIRIGFFLLATIGNNPFKLIQKNII